MEHNTGYYIRKQDLDAYVSQIGGTLVGYTPATPIVWDPSRYYPAVSEYVTKNGVVIIKHWADIPQRATDVYPAGALAIQSTNQRCYDWAIAQPLVNKVIFPPRPERRELFTPAQMAMIDVPEEPAPAGVMIQQTLL